MTESIVNFVAARKENATCPCKGMTERKRRLDEARAYMAKAAESLASAQTDFTAARYNSCANRAYYACFQAAIAALLSAGVQPANPRGEWSHEFVQSQFNGLLINRRKLYPVSLRRVLRDTMEVREKAD
jgi:uncharacterized protein (UPF0332 family)